MISNFIMKIRRRETPFYKNLYTFIKGLRRWSFPSIPWIHLPLYYLYNAIESLIHGFLERMWWIPLFKARVDKGGKGMRLHAGLPCIEGDNLIIELGDNVQFHNNTLTGVLTHSKYYDSQPVLEIGSNTHLGYEVNISIADKVYIGENCLFSSFVYICDNDGHPIDPNKRSENLDKRDAKKVFIGNNVWIGYGAVILKGTTIGNNSIISANTVIPGIVIPANVIAYGNPVKFKEFQEHF